MQWKSAWKNRMKRGREKEEGSSQRKRGGGSDEGRTETHSGCNMISSGCSLSSSVKELFLELTFPKSWCGRKKREESLKGDTNKVRALRTFRAELETCRPLPQWKMNQDSDSKDSSHPWRLKQVSKLSTLEAPKAHLWPLSTQTTRALPTLVPFVIEWGLSALNAWATKKTLQRHSLFGKYRNTFPVFDLGLDAFHRVSRFDSKSDCSTGQSLDEDLHELMNQRKERRGELLSKRVKKRNMDSIPKCQSPRVGKGLKEVEC